LSIKPGATARPSASIVRAAAPLNFADLDDLAVLDPDIAAERRNPRAVDESGHCGSKIIRHRFLSSSLSRVARRSP